MADMSALSQADLEAIAAGDMAKVSDAGLQILAGPAGPRFQYGAADSALQGATFGWADELGAAKDAALGGGGYSDNLRDRRVAQQMYERANPGKAMAAELGGAAAISVLPGIGAMRAATMPAIAARIGPTAARYAGAVAGGATSGAITGAGTAEPGQRGEGALRGGVTGAVIGPMAVGGMQAVGKGAQVARDATVGIPVVQQAVGAVSRLGGATTDFTRRAEEKLLQALKRDNLTPEDIVLADQALRRAGRKPETLIERAGPNTLGLGDVAAKYPGEARRMATDLAGERMAGQADRITGDLSAAFRVQGNPAEIAKALAGKRMQEAAPLYQQAYQEGAQLADPRLAGFMQLPAFQRAYGVARRLATYDGIEMPKDPRKLEAFDLRTMDYVKRGLDDVLYSGKRQGSIGNTEMGKIGAAKEEFVNVLDELVPTYRAARAAWAGPTTLQEALESGQQFNKMPLPELQQTLSRMSAAEVEQFKIGALASLRDRILTARDGRNVVAEVYGSPMQRQVLAELVGPDQVQRLETQFMRERAIRRTDDTIRGNSKTAERQAGMADLEGATTPVQSIMQQGPLRGTLDYVLRSATGVAQPTADKLAPMMFSTNPAERAALMQRLTELDKLMRQRAAGIGTGVGTGFGASGGLLQE